MHACDDALFNRARFTRMYGAAEAICHLILEDLRLLQTDGEKSSG